MENTSKSGKRTYRIYTRELRPGKVYGYVGVTIDGDEQELEEAQEGPFPSEHEAFEAARAREAMLRAAYEF